MTMAIMTTKPSQLEPVPQCVDQTIQELRPWFHNIHLPDGSQTAPNHPLGDFPAYKWKAIGPHLPIDLSGWRVLEIGCNAGYYTVALAQRGATLVAIDINPHYLRQARWVLDQHGLSDQVELRLMQIYDLAHTDESFDLVFFMGVFYHLRYPLLGLDIVAQKTRRLMVFQTLMVPGEELPIEIYDMKLTDREEMREAGWPKLAFIEHSFCKDPTNWWVPNKGAVLALLRSSGLCPLSQIAPETFLCEPDPEHPSSVTGWNRPEYLSATGQSWQQSFVSMKPSGMETHPQNGQQRVNGK
jgi:tRNA (mo5U34)-methyltransferase